MQKDSLQNRDGVVKTLGEWAQEAVPVLEEEVGDFVGGAIESEEDAEDAPKKKRGRPAKEE